MRLSSVILSQQIVTIAGHACCYEAKNHRLRECDGKLEVRPPDEHDEHGMPVAKPVPKTPPPGLGWSSHYYVCPVVPEDKGRTFQQFNPPPPLQ